MTYIFNTLGICFFLLIVSCGKGFNAEMQSQNQLTAAYFWMKFSPLNRHVGFYEGWGTISVVQNQFWVRIKVSGEKTKDMHAQFMHVNSRCPTDSDDLNHDGFLDSSETMKITGPVLIPLDSNLISQYQGLDVFPKMTFYNFYYYSETTNNALMILDLHRPDLVRNDHISKLSQGEGLNLNQRVVVIYGIAQEHFLPDTVNSFNGYPSQFSLPIACGKVFEGENDIFHHLTMDTI